MGSLGREIYCFFENNGQDDQYIVGPPNLIVGGPVSPGPYGCCIYALTWRDYSCYVICRHIIIIHAADLPDSNLAAYVKRPAGPLTASVGLGLGL